MSLQGVRDEFEEAGEWNPGYGSAIQERGGESLEEPSLESIWGQVIMQNNEEARDGVFLNLIWTWECFRILLYESCNFCFVETYKIDLLNYITANLTWKCSHSIFHFRPRT